MLKKNVGHIDRLVRIIVGTGLLALVFILDGNVRWFGLAGIAPLLTATFRWCPAYRLLGVSSCRPNP